MKQGGITPWRDKDEVLTCSTPLLFTPYHGHKSVTLGSYDVKGNYLSHSCTLEIDLWSIGKISFSFYAEYSFTKTQKFLNI